MGITKIINGERYYFRRTFRYKSDAKKWATFLREQWREPRGIGKRFREPRRIGGPDKVYVRVIKAGNYYSVYSNYKWA